MSEEWAGYWTYEWIRDIGLPTLSAIGTIAVGAGAIIVGVSSNRVASSIAASEHNLQNERDTAAELDSRVVFGALVIRWSDRLIEEIRRPYKKVVFPSDPVREPSEDLKAEVVSRAAAFKEFHGRDFFAGIVWLTARAPGENTPDAGRAREVIDEVREAYVQSWVSRPETWTELARSARDRLSPDARTLADTFHAFVA